MKIAVLVGTRPEIIKMSPVIRALNQSKVDWVLIHSNQHYSPEMDSIFFDDLNLPQPNHNLKVESRSHAGMTAEMMKKLETIFEQEKPRWLLVQGDTNTVLAGALTASKMGICVGHVEAGLRSYDRTMPEEINRIVTDHVSDLLFAPTETQQKILLDEGVDPKKIFVTGNTVVDAVQQHIDFANKVTLPWKEKRYAVVTLHRPSNVDDAQALESILLSLEQTSKELELPMMFLAHPRTQAKLIEFKLRVPKGITTISPLGYLQMVKALKLSTVVLTDSGGIQEEACILGVPCVTIRTSTERPETVEVGANRLSSPDDLLDSTRQAISDSSKWINPFGDGTAGEKIVKLVLERE